MWREKIIDAKKAKNITTKMMSEKVRLPEATITRILTCKTKAPRIDTVLGLGAAVGLSAMELFAETNLFLCDKSLSELEEELAKAKDAISVLAEENAELKAKKLELIGEISGYKIQLDVQNEMLTLYRRVFDYETNKRESDDTVRKMQAQNRD